MQNPMTHSHHDAEHLSETSLHSCVSIEEQVGDTCGLAVYARAAQLQCVRGWPHSLSLGEQAGLATPILWTSLVARTQLSVTWTNTHTVAPARAHRGAVGPRSPMRSDRIPARSLLHTNLKAR